MAIAFVKGQKVGAVGGKFGGHPDFFGIDGEMNEAAFFKYE